MNSKYLEDMNKDFNEFMNAENIKPPKDVEDKIFAFVRKELNPSPWMVFSKLSLIHFFTAIVSLSLCPQFGVRIFGEGLGLVKVFFHLGTFGCMVLCGAFFVGLSIFLAGLVLRREELKVLRRYRWLQVSALALLSLGAFIMADAEIVFVFGLAWAFGSLLGGVSILELSYLIRNQALRST